MSRTDERWAWHEGLWRGRAALKDPPPTIAQRLSEHWGATSLHGMVFRTPKAFIWWHCDKCQMRSTPSGWRSLEIPAVGPLQMHAACSLAHRFRVESEYEMERDGFVATLGRPEKVVA